MVSLVSGESRLGTEVNSADGAGEEIIGAVGFLTGGRVGVIREMVLSLMNRHRIERGDGRT